MVTDAPPKLSAINLARSAAAAWDDVSSSPPSFGNSSTLYTCGKLSLRNAALCIAGDREPKSFSIRMKKSSACVGVTSKVAVDRDITLRCLCGEATDVLKGSLVRKNKLVQTRKQSISAIDEAKPSSYETSRVVLFA